MQNFELPEYCKIFWYVEIKCASILRTIRIIFLDITFLFYNFMFISIYKFYKKFFMNAKKSSISGVLENKTWLQKGGADLLRRNIHNFTVVWHFCFPTLVLFQYIYCTMNFWRISQKLLPKLITSEAWFRKKTCTFLLLLTIQNFLSRITSWFSDFRLFHSPPMSN